MLVEDAARQGERDGKGFGPRSIVSVPAGGVRPAAPANATRAICSPCSTLAA